MCVCQLIAVCVLYHKLCCEADDIYRKRHVAIDELTQESSLQITLYCSNTHTQRARWTAHKTGHPIFCILL